MPVMGLTNALNVKASHQHYNFAYLMKARMEFFN